MAKVREIHSQLNKIVLRFIQNRLLVLIVMLLSPFLLLSTSYALEGNNGIVERLQFAIEMDKETYRVGEDIVFNCIFENLSEQIIYLAPGLFGNLKCYVRNEEETEEVELAPTTYGHPFASKQDIFNLYPKAKYIVERRLEKSYYLLPTGIMKYKFFVIYRQVMDEYLGVKVCKGELRSNMVQFEIRESEQ